MLSKSHFSYTLSTCWQLHSL